MQHSELRAQFPLIHDSTESAPLSYLDTAATSQKPETVIQAMTAYYRNTNANVHRAAHRLSAKATSGYEAVREQVKEFIHAASCAEIIFTQGTTASINMLAYGLSAQIKQDDIILIDSAAHHANLVPWQQLAKRTGAKIIPIPLNDELKLDVKAYDQLLQQKPALVALGHVSNALGTLNPVNELVAKAKQAGAITFIDGAQAAAHLALNMQSIDCDFYAFSGHKMYGPTGIGILYGKFEQLNKLIPMQTGGEMIKSVSFEQTLFGELPNRLEAGTPPIAEVIGLGAAIAFLQSLPKGFATQHEQELMTYLYHQLQEIEHLHLYGASEHNIGAIAFNVADEHHQDVGILLDQQGIAVRCGHHCAMPLMQSLNIKGCCRASLGIYSNKDDIDKFIDALKSTIDLLI